jgi:mycofactocin system transcriptional regulator
MGRPPATTHAQLAALALELFVARGFDETSVDDIAAAAGVSRRTFFRYFPTKAAVLWHEFDEEVEQLRVLLAAADPVEPMLSAIHHALVETNRMRPGGVRELRARMTLINTVESLKGPTALHYAGWVRVVGDFVAARTGVPEQSLFPVTVGRTVLATALAAYDLWVDHEDRALVHYLDEALGALADGFDEAALRERAAKHAFTRRRPRLTR